MSKYSLHSRSLLKLSGAIVPQKRGLDLVEAQRVVVRETYGPPRLQVVYLSVRWHCT